MSLRFDPTQGLVVISAELTGPAGSAVIRLALDTGATSSLINLRRIKALGESRSGFGVLCHTLPPSASVDGLLGLDFLRKKELKIDFRKGTIDVR
jgi:hypothetical protein